jgi:hypothetical protein
MLQASEFRRNMVCKLGIFNAGVNRHFENTSLALLMKRKYQIPSNISTKVAETFFGFPWSIQTVVEIEH